MLLLHGGGFPSGGAVPFAWRGGADEAVDDGECEEEEVVSFLPVFSGV